MIRHGSVFREIAQNCWDPVTRAEECQRDGVHVQVLSTIPILFSYWASAEHAHDLSRYLNDHIAGICRAQPANFLGLGTLPMQSPKLAIKELERCMDQLGLAGVQIGSHIERTGEPDWNLDDPHVVEVLQACASLNAAVFVHPWDMMGSSQMPRHWLPWLVGMPAETARAMCSILLGGILEKIPALRMAFAHGGGSFPGTIGRIEHGYNCRPDLVATNATKSPRETLGSFWVDSLVHDQDALKTIMRLFGENKVALGTDYPFPLGEQHPGSLIDSIEEFSPTLREKLRGLNSLDFLGPSATKQIRQHHQVSP
jgi:aminocarboxymuconate-semialdehyde decarboxylase